MSKRQGHISIDNGLTDDTTPEQAIARYPWDTIVHYMDDDLREQVHADMAPCTDLEFLTAYLAAGGDICIG